MVVYGAAKGNPAIGMYWMASYVMWHRIKFIQYSALHKQSIKYMRPGTAHLKSFIDSTYRLYKRWILPKRDEFPWYSTNKSPHCLLWKSDSCVMLWPFMSQQPFFCKILWIFRHMQSVTTLNLPSRIIVEFKD